MEVKSNIPNEALSEGSSDSRLNESFEKLSLNRTSFDNTLFSRRKPVELKACGLVASGESAVAGYCGERKSFKKVDWRPHHDLYSRRSIKKHNKKSLSHQQKQAIRMVFLEAAMETVIIKDNNNK